MGDDGGRAGRGNQRWRWQNRHQRMLEQLPSLRRLGSRYAVPPRTARLRPWSITKGTSKDNCVKLDVRLLLKSTDGALILMTYYVLRHGPPAVMQALDRGETVDPASYYFRLNGLFETAAPKYDWLNRVIAIGIGDRPPDGPIYNVFELL